MHRIAIRRINPSRTVAAALRCFFTQTRLHLKKSGKPLETPPAYKQAYLPYDVPPTKTELEAARRKFLRVPLTTNRAAGKSTPLPVHDVPDNMFVYGKEGMQLPISIFKDEQDPIIGPEHTYPGIYENKILLKNMTTGELLDAMEKGEFDSPLRRTQLMTRVNVAMGATALRMANIQRRMKSKWEEERASVKLGGKAGKVAANPDKDKAASTPPKAEPESKGPAGRGKKA